MRKNILRTAPGNTPLRRPPRLDKKSHQFGIKPVRKKGRKRN